MSCYDALISVQVTFEKGNPGNEYHPIHIHISTTPLLGNQKVMFSICISN